MACPLCDAPDATSESLGGVKTVSCPVCGTFRMNTEVSWDLASDWPTREMLSALARYRAERGEDLLIEKGSWNKLLETAPTPKSLPEALESFLLYIGERQKRFSLYVQIDARRFPITVASNFEDFRYVADLLIQAGYAEVYDDAMRDGFRLTPAGWTRLNELRVTRPDSRRAFVAMWFADELTLAWTEGIRPGLEDAGYTAVRLDAVEHNEKIDDRIIAEIRRSGLVVADLTGGRANVHFEAGFAMGLGIPVIWTCREDHLDDLHFDTRQYNYIGWETPAELRERLRLRIEATLPRKG